MRLQITVPVVNEALDVATDEHNVYVMEQEMRETLEQILNSELEEESGVSNMASVSSCKVVYKPIER